MEASKFIVPDPVIEGPLVSRGRAALKRMRKAMAALEATQLRPINIDIPLAVTRGLGVLPAIASLRDRMEKECPGVQLSVIDQLQDRALATQCLNGDFETAKAPPAGFQSVVNEVFDSRTGLMTVLRMLVALNYIDEQNITSLNGGHGYRDAANDLVGIVGLINRNWGTLEGKVPLTQEHLERFQALGEKLLAMVGEREQTPARVDEVADQRQRAFTLLDQAYDEVRRAVTFLRWHEGDADSVAPPLRVRVPGRRPGEKAEEVVVSPAKPGDPIVASPAKPAEPVVAPEVKVGPAPSGLPRNNPFTA